MHVEVRLDLAAFLLEQHREEKAGAEPATELREKSRPSAWTESWRRASISGKQICPDYDVPIFNVGKPGIGVSFFRIRLGGGENAIEVRGIRLVLPMVLERVNVDLRTLWRRRAWLERR